MSTQQLHRAAAIATTVVVMSVVAGCSTTTAGTAAVGTDFTPSTSSASTTTTATTTRTSRPTTTAESTPASATPTETSGSAMSTATTPLGVRDCYTVADNSDIDVIDCAALHDGQVFQADVVPSGVDPYETDGGKLFDSAEIDCAAAFESFTGAALGSEEAAYTLGLVLTSAPGASTVVACTVVDKDGAQWAGTAESISGSYRGIVVGDCFDYPTPTEDAVKLTCDQPHDAEMFVVDAPLGLDAADAPYPTTEQWQDLSSTICETPFTDYTGLAADAATDLSFIFVFPLAPDWSVVPERLMSCAIASNDGTKLVGSKKQP